MRYGGGGKIRSLRRAKKSYHFVFGGRVLVFFPWLGVAKITSLSHTIALVQLLIFLWRNFNNQFPSLVNTALDPERCGSCLRAYSLGSPWVSKHNPCWHFHKCYDSLISGRLQHKSWVYLWSRECGGATGPILIGIGWAKATIYSPSHEIYWFAIILLQEVISNTCELNYTSPSHITYGLNKMGPWWATLTYIIYRFLDSLLKDIIPSFGWLRVTVPYLLS